MCIIVLNRGSERRRSAVQEQPGTGNCDMNVFLSGFYYFMQFLVICENFDSKLLGRITREVPCLQGK